MCQYASLVYCDRLIVCGGRELHIGQLRGFYCSLIVIKMIMMDGVSSMTREDRRPSLLCRLSAQSNCLFLML